VAAGADSIRIVVVDDHQMVADTLVRALTAEHDMDVVAVAGTVAGALDEVRLQRPDVVVLDFHLPDGTGADGITALKGAVPTIEVVVITGDIDGDGVFAAIDAGCLGFVTKDRAVDELISAVRAVSRGEPAISPAVLRRLVKRNERQRDLGLLTPRELAVLERLAAGCSNDTIAAELFVSTSTVRNHIQSVLSKLDAHSKLEAVVKGVIAGYVKITG
jgi:DNA-binding NarL/FixJ family response regulator